MAISAHASRVAGSVALRANPSQASALCRYLSGILGIVMLHIMAGAQRPQSPINAQNCGDIEPTLEAAGRSRFRGQSGSQLKSGCHWGPNQAIEGRNKPIPGPRYRPNETRFEMRCLLAHLGGRSSLFSQPVAASDFSGSGRSQSRHWNLRCPLPPGGSARIKKAPQSGQVGLSAWPIITI